MPFRSQAQRRFMYSQHPDIAVDWRKRFGPQKGLPERSPAKRTTRRRRRGRRDRRQQLIQQFLAQQSKR